MFEKTCVVKLEKYILVWREASNATRGSTYIKVSSTHPKTREALSVWSDEGK